MTTLPQIVERYADVVGADAVYLRGEPSNHLVWLAILGLRSSGYEPETARRRRLLARELEQWLADVERPPLFGGAR